MASGRGGGSSAAAWWLQGARNGVGAGQPSSAGGSGAGEQSHGGGRGAGAEGRDGASGGGRVEQRSRRAVEGAEGGMPAGEQVGAAR